MSSDDADYLSGLRDTGPSDDTVFAAQTVLRNITYLDSTRHLAMRVSNVEERDEALKRCVTAIDTIMTVEDGTYGIIRFDAKTIKCPIATAVLDCIALASQIKKHLRLLGDCYLIEDAFSDQFDLVRSNVVRLTHNLALLPEQPTDSAGTFEGWMPSLLLPSPCQIADLQQRIERLAKVLENYEQRLVGRPVRSVAIDHSSEQIWFVELLASIERVGRWDTGEGHFNDGPEPLLVDWCGWPDQCELYRGWADYGPLVYWEVIRNLCDTGVFPPNFNGSLRMVFHDLCFKRPEAIPDTVDAPIPRDDLDDVLTIPDDAKFQTLNDQNSPVLASWIQARHDTSLADLLEYYADEVSMFYDELAARRTPDGRHYRIDLKRIGQYHMPGDAHPKEDFYPDDLLNSDVFKAAFELEGLTGVRLANYGDPVWLLMQHQKYKKSVAEFGETATFRDYMNRLYSDQLIDSAGGMDESETNWLEREAQANEMLSLDYEVPQVVSVKYTPPGADDQTSPDSQLTCPWDDCLETAQDQFLDAIAEYKPNQWKGVPNTRQTMGKVRSGKQAGWIFGSGKSEFGFANGDLRPLITKKNSKGHWLTLIATSLHKKTSAFFERHPPSRFKMRPSLPRDSDG